jgi:multiple sugar transport system permease protein
VKWRIIILVLIATVYLAPCYWMFSGAFQSASVIIKMPPSFFPYTPTLENFAGMLGFGGLLVRWVANTVLITVVSVAGALAVNGCAAYAFSMFRFKGSQFILVVFLASMMVTRYALLIPTFVLLRWYGISGYLAVILPSLFWPTGIYLAVCYFKTIPASLVESARIDGAHEGTILARVVAPLCKPLVAALIIFKGLEVMQDYIWPFLVLQSDGQMTLLVALIRSLYNRMMATRLVDYGYANAVGVVLFVPLLAVFLLASKYFVSGLALGSVKE